jgi:hypothetical protein
LWPAVLVVTLELLVTKWAVVAVLVVCVAQSLELVETAVLKPLWCYSQTKLIQ